MPLKDKAARARYQAARHAIRSASAPLYNRKSQAKIRDFIWNKKSHPCADCGIQYPPWVMDLDHREQGEKHERLRTVNGRRRSQTIWSLPWDEMVAEVEKCDVVCANCHRQRTYIKKQTAWRRDAATPEADTGDVQIPLF